MKLRFTNLAKYPSATRYYYDFISKSSFVEHVLYKRTAQSLIIPFLEFNYRCFPVLLEENITNVKKALVLHQVLCLSHIAENLISKLCGLLCHGNLDCAAAKVMLSKIFVLVRL